MSKWVWPAARCNQHKVTFLLHLGLDQPTECTNISFTVLQGFLPLTLPCPYFFYGKAQEACSVPTWVPCLEEATMSSLESFTDVAFLLLILLVFPTGLQLQYSLVDIGVFENACMLTAPVPGSLQCKRDAILLSQWNELMTHYLSYSYWPLPYRRGCSAKNTSRGRENEMH